MAGGKLDTRLMLRTGQMPGRLWDGFVKSIIANGGDAAHVLAMLRLIEKRWGSARWKDGEREEDPFQDLSRRLVGDIWTYVGAEKAIELEVDWTASRYDYRIPEGVFEYDLKVQPSAHGNWLERWPVRYVDGKRHVATTTHFRYWLVQYPRPVQDAWDLMTNSVPPDWDLEHECTPPAHLCEDVANPATTVMFPGKWQFAGFRELVAYVTAVLTEHSPWQKTNTCRIMALGSMQWGGERKVHEAYKRDPRTYPIFSFQYGCDGVGKMSTLEVGSRYRYHPNTFFLVREKQDLHALREASLQDA